MKTGGQGPLNITCVHPPHPASQPSFPFILYLFWKRERHERNVRLTATHWLLLTAAGLRLTIARRAEVSGLTGVNWIKSLIAPRRLPLHHRCLLGTTNMMMTAQANTAKRKNAKASWANCSTFDPRAGRKSQLAPCALSSTIRSCFCFRSDHYAPARYCSLRDIAARCSFC